MRPPIWSSCWSWISPRIIRPKGKNPLLQGPEKSSVLNSEFTSSSSLSNPSYTASCAPTHPHYHRIPQHGMSGHLDPSSALGAFSIKDYIAILAYVSQAVVVILHGSRLAKKKGNIITYQALLSLDRNIITVSAVRSTHTNNQGTPNGQQYS